MHISYTVYKDNYSSDMMCTCSCLSLNAMILCGNYIPPPLPNDNNDQKSPPFQKHKESYGFHAVCFLSKMVQNGKLQVKRKLRKILILFKVLSFNDRTRLLQKKK